MRGITTSCVLKANEAISAACAELPATAEEIGSAKI